MRRNMNTIAQWMNLQQFHKSNTTTSLCLVLVGLTADEIQINYDSLYSL